MYQLIGILTQNVSGRRPMEAEICQPIDDKVRLTTSAKYDKYTRHGWREITRYTKLGGQ